MVDMIHRALGVLIHEMLTGKPPFGYEGPELPQRILKGIYPPPTDESDAARRPTGQGSESQRSCFDTGNVAGPESFLPIVR